MLLHQPKGGRYMREQGVPRDQDQENFTDPDSRVMKRAGGGVDYSYNAQTAVDETAHIIVAAQLTNMAADSAELPAMLDAVRASLDADAGCVLADAGHRGEAVFEQLKDHPTAEPPNGWIKSVLGFRQFSRRGPHRVQAAFKLVCLALNLRRVRALQAG